MLLTIGLSLVAAALFAVAAVLQQQGAAAVDDADAHGTGMLRSLMNRRIWLAGMAADIAGFCVQAWALAVGSLLLVQPLLVTTLLIALPLGAWFDRRALTPREWGWSAVLVAALVVFVVFGQPTEGITQPSFASWLPVLVVGVLVVLACMAAAVRAEPHSPRRSLLIAIAAGVLLGLSAPLTKGAVHGFAAGVVGGLIAWELWGMALTASLGTFWQQSSYQAGDVQTSLPAVTVLKPVVAMVIALTIYEERLIVSGVLDLILVGALVVMVIATVQLSRLAAPALAGEDEPASTTRSPSG